MTPVVAKEEPAASEEVEERTRYLSRTGGLVSDVSWLGGKGIL